MDWERFITLLLVLIFSLTAHEAAHGLTAWLGGDRTAKDRGLVTLNPIPHMKREPMGMIVVPVIVIFLSNCGMAAGGGYLAGGAVAGGAIAGGDAGGFALCQGARDSPGLRTGPHGRCRVACRAEDLAGGATCAQST